MKTTERSSILIIYTGGTIGMIENPETGALENFGIEKFRSFVPELKHLKYRIDVLTFTPPIDSSDMNPTHWTEIANIISKNYLRYDGFVILHGTDTMAYTASALSFMLENIGKPVIITGSQLPIGQLRTDGKENFLTSVEIAAAKTADGEPCVPEVCIFFDSLLMRGNRTTKINSEGFNAFRSYNFPPLAHAGITIKYDTRLILRPDKQKPFTPHFKLDDHVIVLTIFPGIRQDYVERLLDFEGLKAVVLKTYGSGNAPLRPWLVNLLRKLSEEGIIIVNITQCPKGAVEMKRYETGLQLLQVGVSNGYDATLECTITKLMYLLGEGFSRKEIVRWMNTDIAGEISIQ
ncbi:type I asparaginase [Alloprevotella tannerae]|uniref:asparaginase n=1 Tax=Alloprevotella tannerae TaxID=76122 RepID=UPI001EDC2443|nr:type I asparaginase [Alloprevotella tannerae]MCG2647576.1 type I asparaginase [Alloprevotella tannerae]